jgi:hypothetical protein
MLSRPSGPPISVRTQPGAISTIARESSERRAAKLRMSIFNAALLPRYTSRMPVVLLLTLPCPRPEIEATLEFVALFHLLHGAVGERHDEPEFMSSDSDILSGLFLNLFNLLPISALDGGRVTAVLSPRIWLLGVPILLALMLYRPSPVLVIVVILAVPQLMKAWRHDPKAPENVSYYGVPLQTKLEYGGAYLALAALLAVMTYDVHEMLSQFNGPV